MQTRKEKYQEYRQTRQWMLLREFCRWRNKKINNGNLVCEECGCINPKEHDVHHESYPESLVDDSPHRHVFLCRKCHKIKHDLIELSEKEQQEIEDREHDYMINTASEILKHYEG